ncbi:MAG: DUF3796 domain-containing protein [Lachnospiraceae bacterium]|nr:DUF3796 domain-containing protein [Lachnospiraceae bacterium]
MKKSAKVLIGVGVVCLLLLLASVWYAVTFNESRLVGPMDLSEYEFTVKDLPMIVSVIFVTLYAIVLIGMTSVANKKKRITRKINPKLGFLGIAGFLGFRGFWMYPDEKAVGMFLSFIFFGFFGFFFEGKMSDTFMDERYMENKRKAHLNADRAAVNIIFLALLVFGHGRFMGFEYSMVAFVIVVSLAIALDLFLGEYLLYRYDHDNEHCESEE